MHICYVIPAYHASRDDIWLPAVVDMFERVAAVHEVTVVALPCTSTFASCKKASGINTAPSFSVNCGTRTGFVPSATPSSRRRENGMGKYG